jgi:uncharacterized protein YjiS (DUF1127 family)
MSGTVFTRPARTRPSAVRQAPAGVGGWLSWLAAMFRAIESRRRLAEMDPRMLRDIGVTTAEALQEAERAPWDLSPRPRNAPWTLL